MSDSTESGPRVPDRPWQFSPYRLRGHRERMRLTRNELGALLNPPRRQDTIKAVEYGINHPSLPVFLSLADSLGISPNDLCRQHADDALEYQAGLDWTPPNSDHHWEAP